jgi:hypothetical protein
MQVHAIVLCSLQGRIQGLLLELLAANNAYCSNAAGCASSSSGGDMIGKCTSERQNGLGARRSKEHIVLEFAPLVARNLGVDQVVALQHELNAQPLQEWIAYHLHWRTHVFEQEFHAGSHPRRIRKFIEKFAHMRCPLNTRYRAQFPFRSVLS